MNWIYAPTRGWKPLRGSGVTVLPGMVRKTGARGHLQRAPGTPLVPLLGYVQSCPPDVTGMASDKQSGRDGYEQGWSPRAVTLGRARDRQPLAEAGPPVPCSWKRPITVHTNLSPPNTSLVSNPSPTANGTPACLTRLSRRRGSGTGAAAALTLNSAVAGALLPAACLVPRLSHSLGILTNTLSPGLAGGWALWEGAQHPRETEGGGSSTSRVPCLGLEEHRLRCHRHPDSPPATRAAQSIKDFIEMSNCGPFSAFF